MEITTTTSELHPTWHESNPKLERLNEVLLEKTQGKVHQLLEHILFDEDLCKEQGL